MIKSFEGMALDWIGVFIKSWRYFLY